jgi:uncharacterized membrane protein
MAGNLVPHRFQASTLYFQYQFLVCDSFQLLLLLIVFIPVIPTLAGIVMIVLIVLIIARILCINCGKDFYKFPGGKQI